jgi:serine/threonine protein kinase
LSSIEAAAGDPGEFPQSARYRFEGLLGEGGFGTVYRAFDVERGESVALKVLHRTRSSSLVHFKREFRSVADVKHPNLVSLHELSGDSGRWFLTMELVEGLAFLEHLQEHPSSLRALLRQLVDGVAALHAAGLLHRDLKPKNVLVTPTGRVVVLDFGLAAGMATASDSIMGTRGYMAPEYLRGDAPTPAIDWYAVGVILRQAMSRGTPQEATPDSSGEAGGGVSGDAGLLELAARLTAPRPEDRPTAPEILRLLGSAPDPAPPPRNEARPVKLIGRREELAALHRALHETNGSAPRVVSIEGKSGMGKSTLLSCFRAQLRELPTQPIVFWGRCYDRESVPYKAFDGIVDGLASHLKRLPRASREVLPRGATALARLFPALRDVIGAPGRQKEQTMEAPELRRRAFLALRELLGELAERRPVVLLVEDLHWADADSAALCTELLRPPEAPAVLLVTTLRPATAASPRWMRDLLDFFRQNEPACGFSRLLLGPMPEEANIRLAAAALAQAPQPLPAAELEAAAVAIARDSAGVPLFVEWLARRHGSAHGSLDELLRAQARSLPEAAARLLEAVAVAGGPLALPIAQEVTGAPAAGPPLDALRAASLVTPVMTDAETAVDCNHDRTRQAVLGMLGEAERRQLHLRLAAALERRPSPNPQLVYEHYLGAGQRELAGSWAIRAGDAAAAALAFDRAASLYRSALELLPAEGATVDLRSRFAESLSYAGHGAEAGARYEELARDLLRIGGDAAQVADHSRLAFAHYLCAGRLEDGLRVGRGVLAQAGAPLPDTRLKIFAALIRDRLRLAVRGYRFPSTPRPVAAAEVVRMDACWAAAAPLSMVDPLVSHLYYTRHLLAALKSGEPMRVARALGTEATYLVSMGGKRRCRAAERLLETTLRIADASTDADTKAIAQCALGVSAYMRSQWKRALQPCVQWDDMLRDQYHGATWERVTARVFLSITLMRLGMVRELTRRAESFLGEAEAHRDVYAITSLSMSGTHFALLAAGRADEVRRLGKRVIEWWPATGFLLQHFLHLIAMVQTELYEGDGAAAWSLIEEAWPRLEKSFFLRLENNAIELRHLRARAALAKAAALGGGSEARKLIGEASALARRIRAPGQAWSAPLASSLDAAVARLRGDHGAAARFMASAAGSFDQADMPLYASSCRLRLGQWQSSKLAESAHAAMANEGVARPERFSAIFVPAVG